jgi:two-component system chemotaxis sensor kinase CheA
LDAIGDPLVHLLRNAVDHGIEQPVERKASGKPPAGRIELSARRERSRVVIEVTDDGRGIDLEAVAKKARREGLIETDAKPQHQELFRILARPGFSTAERVTTLSGRGVGLNVVEECVRALGGSVELTTDGTVGTRFRMELPLTLAIVRALIVEVAGQVYALPTTFTCESFELPGAGVERAHGREWVNWRGSRLPLTRLRPLFAPGENSDNANNGAMALDRDRVLRVVALEFGATRTAISVDRFVGEEEVVIKPLDIPRGTIPVFSSATVRPDGRPALVIDVGSLSQRYSTLNL